MPFSCRVVFLAFLAAALLFVPASAQIAAGPGLERVAALRSVTLADPPSHRGAEPASDYETEGALIGALALGVPTFLFLGSLCDTGDCTGDVHLWSLGMTAIGAFVGAMIGGGIERKPDTTGAEAP